MDINGEFDLSYDPSQKVSVPNEQQQTSTSRVFSSPHFYSSYCHYPKGITFEEQEENEEIILLLRRHFITNLPWLISAIILILLPVLFPFALYYFPFPLPSPHILLLFLATYYLIICGFVILNFTLWYFQVGLVTNLRAVDVDINGILYREISEAKNEFIQDVTYTQVGFVRSLFNYGDVMVQTAGNHQNVQYDRVPKPATVSRIIGDLIEKNE